MTQEVEDIISSPVVKEAIINNSDCKILLDQREFMNRFDAIQSLSLIHIYVKCKVDYEYESRK